MRIHHELPPRALIRFRISHLQMVRHPVDILAILYPTRSRQLLYNHSRRKSVGRYRNDKVNGALDALRDQFVSHREHLRSTLLQEIASGDNGSEAARIEEFQQADKRIDEFFDVVKSHVAALAIDTTLDATGDPNIDQPANDDIEQDRLELVSRGNELIGSIERQEELITAWFAEVFAKQ